MYVARMKPVTGDWGNFGGNGFRSKNGFVQFFDLFVIDLDL
jgi:hypothetical protein